MLATLVTPVDGPGEWLNAGQALAHVLLLSTAYGVMASFLNQPVKVAELRLPLARAAGIAGFPHLVLRMGYPAQPGETPRRPVDDVVVKQWMTLE